METTNTFNKVVAVTGASAGLGHRIASEFAEHGAKLALMARGQEGLKAVQREVEDLGGEAIVIPTDVSKKIQVEEATDQIEETFGTIDVWINNAMVSVFSPIKEMEADEFKRVTEVTYLGQVYGALAALKK